jgi:hypothetical protein
MGEKDPLRLPGGVVARLCRGTGRATGSYASGERRLDRWPGRGSGLPVVQDGVQHAERVAVDALGD